VGRIFRCDEFSTTPAVHRSTHASAVPARFLTLGKLSENPIFSKFRGNIKISSTVSSVGHLHLSAGKLSSCGKTVVDWFWIRSRKIFKCRRWSEYGFNTPPPSRMTLKSGTSVNSVLVTSRPIRFSASFSFRLSLYMGQTNERTGTTGNAALGRPHRRHANKPERRPDGQFVRNCTYSDQCK